MNIYKELVTHEVFPALSCAEQTIKNMSRISGIGMSQVDETMLGIMEDKKPLAPVRRVESFLRLTPIVSNRQPPSLSLQ